jgi:hypothetical protein
MSKRKAKSNGAAKYRAKKYSAPKGSARAKLLERAAKLYKSGNVKAAAAIREKMEEKERAKKSFKTKKSPYSKKTVKKKGKRRNGNAKKKSRKK